uniref:Salivary glue protein Sgs-3-like n=1 Tax=Saccoglossus kowalevskii TaxID=10224 RepID=A0ABM0ME03_SACKO
TEPIAAPTTLPSPTTVSTTLAQSTVQTLPQSPTTIEETTTTELPVITSATTSSKPTTRIQSTTPTTSTPLDTRASTTLPGTTYIETQPPTTTESTTNAISSKYLKQGIFHYSGLAAPVQGHTLELTTPN